MLDAIQDPEIRAVLTLPETDDAAWQEDLARFESDDVTLTRRSAGESIIEGFQRLLIFLGYSTSYTGAFGIDGDFGRGTNRGLAQFLYDYSLSDHSLTQHCDSFPDLGPAPVDRDTLCYECNWQNAKYKIVAIPDVRLTVPALRAMLAVARRAIDDGDILCGDFDVALEHLNALHRRKYLDCRGILARYGDLVFAASERLSAEGRRVHPLWILSILRQETAGIVRPRFEQHHLSKYHVEHPDIDLAELRYRSMSFGLGQILGIHYEKIGAPSARAMFSSLLDEQVLFVGRFLAGKGSVVASADPSEEEFRAVARYYNGPGYARHHYHESLETWFREFRGLLG